MGALKGFTAASFMALGAFSAWEPVSRAILFLIGFAILVDAIMPVDRSLYAVTCVFFFVLGGLFGFFAWAAGAGMAYLAITILMAAVVYLDRLRRLWQIGRSRMR